MIRITMDNEDFRIFCGPDEKDLQEFCRFDGHILNPEKVGCMTGTMIGMYATGNGADSDNKAEFSFFELK